MDRLIDGLMVAVEIFDQDLTIRLGRVSRSVSLTLNTVSIQTRGFWVYRMIEEEPSIETEDESEDTDEPESPEDEW